MSKAFQDGIVFAKLLNLFSANSVNLDDLQFAKGDVGISFRFKRSNVKKAYDAALALSIVNEDEFKAIDFVKGEEDAILHFLIKANAKYPFRNLGDPV